MSTIKIVIGQIQLPDDPDLNKIISVYIVFLQHPFISATPDRYIRQIQQASDSYSAPSNSQYFAPSASASKSYQSPSDSYQAPSGTYKSPANSYKSPGNSYKAPGNSYQAPSDSYQSPGRGTGNNRGPNRRRPLNTGYRAPSGEYSAPNQGYSAPDGDYLAPGNGYGAPSDSYQAQESVNNERRIPSYKPSSGQSTFYSAPQSDVLSFFDNDKGRTSSVNILTINHISLFRRAEPIQSIIKQRL